MGVYRVDNVLYTGLISNTDMRRSHILIVGIILAFSAYFFTANRRQQTGKVLIEGTVSTECIAKPTEH